MITKRKIALITCPLSASYLNKAKKHDQSYSKMIMDHLKQCLAETVSISSHMSTRSGKYISYIDSKVNRFHSPGLFNVILFLRLSSMLSKIDPQFRTTVAAINVTVGKLSKSVLEICQELENCISLNTFNEFANSMTALSECLDQVMKDCHEKAKDMMHMTNVYLDIIFYIHQKNKATNHTFIREDIIDKKTFAFNHFSVDEYEPQSVVTFESICNHVYYEDMFNYVVKISEELNEFMHQEIIKDDETYFKYARYLQIYEDLLTSLIKFNEQISRFINDALKYTCQNEWYLKILKFYNLVKRTLPEDEIKRIPEFDKFNKNFDEVPLAYLHGLEEPREITLNGLSNEEYDLDMLKKVVKRACSFAKANCVTYEDVQFAIQSYWYTGENSLYKPGLILIRDSITEIEHVNVMYEGENVEYITSNKPFKKSIVNKNYCKKFPTEDLMRAAIRTDGLEGLYVQKGKSDLPIVYQGSDKILNLAFEKYIIHKAISLVDYKAKDKLKLQVTYDKDLMPFRKIVLPKQPDYTQGFDFSALFDMESGLILPTVKQLEVSSISYVDKDKTRVEQNPANLKLIVGRQYLTHDTDYTKEQIEKFAKEMIDNVISNERVIEPVEFNYNNYTACDQILTPKSDILQKMFGIDKYVAVKKPIKPVSRKLLYVDSKVMASKNFFAVINNAELKAIAENGTHIGLSGSYEFTVPATADKKAQGWAINPAEASEARRLNLCRVNCTMKPHRFMMSHGGDTIADVGNHAIKRFPLIKTDFEDVFKTSEDFIHYINVDKLTVGSEHIEFLNSLAWISMVPYWCDSYAQLMLSYADQLIEVFFDMCINRPHLYTLDKYLSLCEGADYNNATLKKIYDDYLEEVESKKGKGIVDTKKVLLKISMYLNVISGVFKIKYIHPAYLIKCMKIYNDFRHPEHEIRAAELTSVHSCYFNDTEFNVWDVIDAPLGSDKSSIEKDSNQYKTLIIITPSAGVKTLSVVESEIPTDRDVIKKDKYLLLSYQYTEYENPYSNNILIDVKK